MTAAAAKPLLIGIGNVLRADDGAGYRLAERLLEPQPQGWEVLPCHQLTPELASAVAQASRVLFVDACMELASDGRRHGLHPLQAATSASGRNAISHGLRPEQLLSLSQQLYGHCPPASLLLLPGRCWGHSDQLSAETAQALAEALPIVERWRQGDA